MRASVVIRVRDEAAALERLLRELADQSAAHEVVVVDSGSRDGSADVARAAGARVLEIPARAFTFGRALNLGAAACVAETIVALSAHAYPREAGWLERMAAALDDPQVACTFGPSHDAAGQPLRAAIRQDAALVAGQPFWGYSNGAGAFRAALWRGRGFREDLPGCEDREWALWAMQAGYVCLLDPALAVDHDHSKDSLRQSFRRYAREARGDSAFVDLPPYRVRDAAGEWWTDQGWHRSRARARLDPRRAARLAGKWWGRR
ncbi:MAG: glycosyltransferase [Solirubrobacteraceae bacterium]